jgi:AhpD family alkylhydroperoxidase
MSLQLDTSESSRTREASNTRRRPLRHQGLVRVVLLALGAVQLTNGVWALFAPESFYGDYPFGRGWVELLPAYSEHLVRDLGGLYLATAGLFVGAALALSRATVIIACASWLLFALPHAIYHGFNLEPFSTGDAIANAIVLTAALLLPVWALATVLRRPRATGAPRHPLADPSTSGRIRGVSDDTRNLLTRASFRESRRRYGAVMEPMRVFAHHPKVMLGYAALEMASERSRLVSARVKHLAELRAGMICGCEWCLDFGSSISAKAGIGEEELRELLTYQRSSRFSELEKLVLDYATGMSRSPVDVSDALFDRLREHFDEAQLVELTNIIALENYRARFNWALGIGGQGFSEGAFCVPPEVAQAVNEPA